MGDIVIRPLTTHAERRACVRIQEETWGGGFADLVPSSILMIAGETGGVASGAFDGDTLIGFVFGISGFRDGRRVHWSDMLAVLPPYRDRGVGARLKLHQRDLLLGHGVEVVYWTFDPLVARNAYLNLRRLGALARTYKPDLYGRSNSPLHQGIGTDRLLAEWWIASDRVVTALERRSPEPDPGAVRMVLNPVPGPDPAAPGSVISTPAGSPIEILVPADIQALKGRAPERALEWRRNVRDAFVAAFEAGYTATDVIRGKDFARYILVTGNP